MAKKTFVKGAMILGIAGLITKIMGAFFRIPLGNIIGDTGMGYYQTAYPVYVLLLTLSTAGIPTAIARMVSERTAEGNSREAFRIFRLSFTLMFSIGIISSLILFLGAPTIVNIAADPKAVYAMRSIAPALIIVPVMAAFRGYFQGLQDMTPTGVSQVVEQLFRVAVGLAAAFLLLDKGLEFAAAGASFGATAGAIFGLLVVVVMYLMRRSSIKESYAKADENKVNEPTGQIMKKIVLIAIPITIGAAIIPIMNCIDLGIVIRRLVATGLTTTEANSLYGQLSGFAMPVINFPQVLTQGMAVSLVPAIAAACKEKDAKFLKYNTELALRSSMIIGMPCAAGIFVLSKPILLLLYPFQQSSALNAAPCLAVLGISFIFLSSVQTMTGILQGFGKQWIPVRNLFIGVLFKIVITYFLIPIPSINVKGAAIGTMCAYLIAMPLNILAVKKYSGVKIDWMITYIKPGAAAFAMGIVVWAVYKGVSAFSGNVVSTFVSVLCGVIVYAVLIIIVKGITKDELEKIPLGKYVTRIISKLDK